MKRQIISALAAKLLFAAFFSRKTIFSKKIVFDVNFVDFQKDFCKTSSSRRSFKDI